MENRAGSAFAQKGSKVKDLVSNLEEQNKKDVEVQVKAAAKGVKSMIVADESVRKVLFLMKVPEGDECADKKRQADIMDVVE
ncbi:unnamed protein product [Linum trigynum]|uniref:Uncharacterized protein n=1 Tax=Linum trigynum TaxID=586398 RepID=A0AAV2DVS3_9ROSI